MTTKITKKGNKYFKEDNMIIPAKFFVRELVADIKEKEEKKNSFRKVLKNLRRAL